MEMSVKVDVPLIRIRVTDLFGVSLPDGTLLGASFCTIFSRNLRIPSSPHLVVPLEKPLMGGCGRFKQGMDVYFAVPSDEFVIQISLVSLKDTSISYTRDHCKVDLSVDVGDVLMDRQSALRPYEKCGVNVGQPVIQIRIEKFRDGRHNTGFIDFEKTQSLIRTTSGAGSRFELKKYVSMFELEKLLAPFLPSPKEDVVEKVNERAPVMRKDELSPVVPAPAAPVKKEDPTPPVVPVPSAPVERPKPRLFGRRFADEKKEVKKEEIVSVVSVPKPEKKTEVEFSEAPLQFDPVSLMFGCSTNLVPVDKDLEQVVKITNPGHSVVFCNVVVKSPEPYRYTCTVDKSSLTIMPGKTETIKIVLHLYCSTDLEVKIPVEMWREGDEKASMVKLRGGIYGMPSLRLDPDDLIVDDGCRLGEGSFGVVYRGKYRGMSVAIKKIKDREAQLSFSDEPDGDKTPFQKEVEVMEALRHPAIVHFVGYAQNPQMMVIVTEFCEMGSLQTVIEKYPRVSNIFRVKALLDVAGAMNFFHKCHFIHRDLKTENILVTSLEVGAHPNEMAPVAKLSDFGTSRGFAPYKTEERASGVTKNVGTPIFSAPEVLNGSRSYTSAVDVYSFGIMMAHVFSGRMPFLDPPMARDIGDLFQRIIHGGMRPNIPKDIPKCLETLMTDCWDGKPTLRPTFERAIPELLKGLNQICSFYESSHP